MFPYNHPRKKLTLVYTQTSLKIPKPLDKKKNSSSLMHKGYFLASSLLPRRNILVFHHDIRGHALFY